MKTYRAAVIGVSRMGAFIDNEMVGYPGTVPPYSHAASYTTYNRTELVACADLRPEIMAVFGQQYHVPPERQYTDYREMINKEQPDIVSVATQPEQRAEIVIYAANHGVKAIYAEKPLAASMAEADAMVEAVERNHVVFNMGTNRRWGQAYDKIKEIMDSGQIGTIKTLIVYSTGAIFDTASHHFDTLNRLNDDQPVKWVQANIPTGDTAIDGDFMRQDPQGEGIIKYANGVTAYALLTPRSTEYEVIGDKGSITAFNDAYHLQLRQDTTLVPGTRWNGFVTVEAPTVPPDSSGLNLVNDLIHALDTGAATRGGIRVARASIELTFAFIESHMRGGARVDLPLQGSKMKLQRNRAPRQPKFTA
ncbi:MAG: Gfo/Idh/MocA family oxidoreductase [Chloroflexi bacterium]|nr:Gfo/Idh/MocA family oxidoreductase [Chloroflexota bacterium]